MIESMPLWTGIIFAAGIALLYLTFMKMLLKSKEAGSAFERATMCFGIAVSFSLGIFYLLFAVVMLSVQVRWI